MNNVKGFTLLELVVTVAVAGVLLGVGIPSFESFIKRNQRATAVNALVTSIQLSRSEAYKRNQVITLCRSSNGTACQPANNWSQGWIVFVDLDNDAVVDGGETILQLQAGMEDRFVIPAGPVSLRFQGNGRGNPASAGTFILCDADPDPADRIKGRRIAVNASGRPRVREPELSDC